LHILYMVPAFLDTLGLARFRRLNVSFAKCTTSRLYVTATQFITTASVKMTLTSLTS